MVIVGGGPTGLMLAGELALAGVDVAIVERRLSQELAGSRAGGAAHVHPSIVRTNGLKLWVTRLPSWSAWIRPDGYVAWVCDLDQCGLVDALTTWFGLPA